MSPAEHYATAEKLLATADGMPDDVATLKVAQAQVHATLAAAAAVSELVHAQVTGASSPHFGPYSPHQERAE